MDVSLLPTMLTADVLVRNPQNVSGKGFQIISLKKTGKKLKNTYPPSIEIIPSSSSELRIASMIKNGLTSQEIADLLHISLDTVKTHRRGIRKKLNLNNSNINLSS